MCLFNLLAKDNEPPSLFFNCNMQRNGSSLQRNNTTDIFRRSGREEDDEEVLKWAALEKLPTYTRMKKGLLTAEGQVKEVDINSLGFEEQRELLERLTKAVEEDNEKFLMMFKNRIDRVGIDLPTIEVRFEHLSVGAEVYVGGRASPNIINFYLNVIQGFLNYLRILPSKKRRLTILNDVSGIIQPRRMTLLLGPPSSGKTTLLLALAGKLDSDLKVSGRVTYNGHGMDEFVPRRTSAYISQHDIHIGEMTVRETLAFSARCQGVGTFYDILVEISRREKEANIKPDPTVDIVMKAVATGGNEASLITEYWIKILGLDICADTLVGDGMMRGISGGQRKRVTTGEMLVGPAKALFMDEISTGLDSSTTFQIVKALRQCIHILHGTAVVTLLQPAPETYELFDDIILLSDGQIAYQGPREHVLEFFEYMGFKCPKRKGVADFLQEVTSKKDQKQYWARKEEPYNFIQAKEFAEALQSFHVGRRLADELATPFDKSKNHPAALTTKKYGVKKKELLKACISREYLLMKRNSVLYIFKASQVFIMSLIGMTMFIRTKMSNDNITDGVLYAGSLFLGLTVIMFNGLAEFPMTLARLPVFFKQRDHLFYPAWAFSIPGWILKIPITFMEVAIYVLVTYYVIGYDPSPERLFRQFLLLVCVSQMATGLFRLIAVLGRNDVVAHTFGAFANLVIVVLSGFVLSYENMKKWWLWGFWSSPLMYAQNAIAVNEFLGKRWRHVLPNSTEPLGIMVLKSRGLFTNAYWYWIGVGALLGYILLFNVLATLALEHLKPFETPQAILTEEDGQSVNTSGDAIAMPSEEKNLVHFTSSGEKEVEAKRSIAAGSKSERKDAVEVAKQKKKSGMVLPFQPFSITFEDITYSVDMPQRMKSRGVKEDRLELLKSVSGAFRPGVLTALMGVSGAGKTTLMDVLAGRKTGGYIDGNITISGYPKRQETFARISGYCEQDDIHSPNVTVYESLLFSSWLRLPLEIGSATRKMFVEEIIELVELSPLRGLMVGLPGTSGLSTEQRKRLTIAVELVANPSIVFMDEPTSGLDARAAAIVMRTVRNTVDTGRTVVCTIHQPSIDIFEAFDELFLLKQGGKEIYVGPLGRDSYHLINYLEGVEGVSKIRDGYNPATWMLEVTSGAQEEILNTDFADVYKKSELYGRNKSLIKELSTASPGSNDLHFSTQYTQSFFTQCLACLWKQHWSYWRNPPYNGARYFFTTTVALMLGSIFWDLGSKRGTQQDLFNSIGSLYVVVLFMGMQNATTVQPVVSVERTVFYRERAAGMYSALAYAFGQVVIEVPYAFLQTISYGPIVYSMAGFEWTFAKFTWFLFTMYFTVLYFTFFGMMVVAITPDMQTASIIAVAMFSIWNIFSGFLIPRTRIPIWWRWSYWTSPVAWTLYGLMASQYGDVSEKLDTGVQVKDFLESYFGMKRDFLPVVSGMHIALTLFFAFIFAFSVKIFNFQNR